MATLIGLKGGTTNITISYTEGGTTKTASVSGFTVLKLQGAQPTFNNQTKSVTLAPTSATNSPAVTVGAFTAATAGHGGSISYSIVSVTRYGSSETFTGWSVNSSRVITVPASTVGGYAYYVVVRASEGATDTYTDSYKDATITVTVNKKDQAAPSVSSQTVEYATSGSISGSASGGTAAGTTNFKSDANGGTNYGSATPNAPTRAKSSIGTTTYVAYYEGNNYWNKSPDSSQGTLTVTKAANPITLAPSTATIYDRSGYNTVQLSVTNAQGTVSYTTSSSGKATVNSTGLVTYASSGSATITATAAGNTNYLSGSKTCVVTTVVDTEGTTKYKNEACTTTGSNITYNKPTVTISTGLTAAATSAKVTCTVTNSTSWYQKWASGYVSAHSGTLTGTARWKITSNGSDRFSASGSSYSLSGVGTVYANGASVNHSTMGSYVGSDSVTVTAYNISSSTKTATSTKSVSNAVTSIAITLGSDTINYDDTTSMTVKASYTSGLSTHDVTSAASISTNPSNIITITI